MKKVLFATTALVATAGVAAADVTLSGYAEMGLAGGDGTFDTQFIQDIDATFTMSGSTDNGLTFGASVDLDESWQGDPASGADCDFGGSIDDANSAMACDFDDGGVTIFISGAFGTLTMGDTDGALDWALTEAGNVGNPGSLRDNETAHAGYLGSYADGTGDGQIVRYDNTFGDLGVALSVEQGNTGQGAGSQNTITGEGFAVGLKYSLAIGGGAVNFGAGYQEGVNETEIAGVSATLNLDMGLSAGIQYSDWSNINGVAGAENEHVGVGFGYETGPFAIHANYGEYDSGADGYGLAARYDLGGGAGLHLGMNDNDGESYSFGLAMSF